jgi:hypothetical protein
MMSNTRSDIFKKLVSSWVELKADHPVYWELVPALLRLLLAIIGPILAALIGIGLFEPNTPWKEAQIMHQSPLFANIPVWILILYVLCTKEEFYRYLIAPGAGATFFIILAGANYIKDIYNVSLRPAFLYLISTMFGIYYPRLIIEGGRSQPKEGEGNLLEIIGGPGWALIQPGNSVVFRNLRGPSRASITRPYFMTPFESITQIASLDDQHGHVEKVPTVTKDGIQVVIRDIHFRFRILPEQEGGRYAIRTPAHPYPFDENALRSMAYNLSVDTEGLDEWQRAVQRVIIGSITDYINLNNID